MIQEAIFDNNQNDTRQSDSHRIVSHLINGDK